MLYLILFFIGWTLFITGFVQKYYCEPCQKKYRYIPRKIIDEQLSKENHNVSNMMNKLLYEKDNYTIWKEQDYHQK